MTGCKLTFVGELTNEHFEVVPTPGGFVMRPNAKGLAIIEENERKAAAAGELGEALDYLLQQTIDQDLNYGIGLTEGEQDARKKALAAIAKARGEKTLPPDPDGKNGARAGWAGLAITAFQQATGTDDEDALSDLLGDLLHWCDRNNFDFDAALSRGRWHYDAETGGEEV